MTSSSPTKIKKTSNSNPLYGLKLETILTELSEQYGWETLSEAMNIERFQFHTGYKSTMKWLRKHEWAKDKVEDFYLYVYKNFAWPDDKQLAIPPRDRAIDNAPESEEPAKISDKTLINIEHASDLRAHKKNALREKTALDEPAYDPNNPWNK